MFDALRYESADFSSAAWYGVSASAQDLLTKILEKNPAKRISAEEVLRHPWMKRFAPATPRASAPTSPDASFSPTEAASRGSSGAELGGVLETLARRRSLDSTFARPLGPPSEGPGTSGDECSSRSIHKVGDNIASARVFYTPANLRLRLQLDGFVDAFKQQVERPYQRLLQAADADAAGNEWSAFRLGLIDLDAYLATHGSTEGPYFLGREPSLAEAATAPALFRMVATLVRGQRGSRGWALAGGKRNGAGNYWGAAPIYLSMIIECACIHIRVHVYTHAITLPPPLPPSPRQHPPARGARPAAGEGVRGAGPQAPHRVADRSPLATHRRVRRGRPARAHLRAHGAEDACQVRGAAVARTLEPPALGRPALDCH